MGRLVRHGSTQLPLRGGAPMHAARLELPEQPLLTASVKDEPAGKGR